MGECLITNKSFGKITELWSGTSSTSDINLSDSYKNYNYLCFVAVDTQSVSGAVSNMWPLPALDYVRDTGRSIQVTTDAGYVLFKINSDTQLKYTNGSRLSYTRIYGIK